MCAMTHSYVCHDSFMCVVWLSHMCDMTHSYLGGGRPRDCCLGANVSHSFFCETWLLHMCEWLMGGHRWQAMTWLSGCKRATWLVLIREVTHSGVWHDSFIPGGSLVAGHDMAVKPQTTIFMSSVWHDSWLIMCVIWLIFIHVYIYMYIYIYIYIYI